MVWFLVLVVMLGAGLLGGLAGNLARKAVAAASADKNEKKSANTPIATDMLVGVVSSFCVPIFLFVTQSKLMDTIQSDINSNAKPFLELIYLGGFCLIAAFSSRAFMQFISKRVVPEDVREFRHEVSVATKNLKEDADDYRAEINDSAPAQLNWLNRLRASRITGDEETGSRTNEEFNLAFAVAPAPHVDFATIPELPIPEAELDALNMKLTDADRRVLAALNSENYGRRSITGVSRDANVSKLDANVSLYALEALDLVTHGTGSTTGRLLYQLTSKGGALVARLKADQRPAAF